MKRPLLLAEDDDAIVQVITEILGMEGYSIVHAATEKEVLALASERNPFVIFLDISLSGSDGRVIAKKLRSSTETKDIPIVVVSADADIMTIAETMGADGVLMKPFDIETLLSLAKQYSS